MLAAIEVDTTSLDDIIFPEVVKVSEETGSAQTVIPAALLMEKGALGISLTLVVTKICLSMSVSNSRWECYSSQHSIFQLGGFSSKNQP